MIPHKIKNENHVHQKSTICQSNKCKLPSDDGLPVTSRNALLGVMGNHIQIPSGFCHIDKSCPSPLFPQRAFFIFPKKERSQDESQIYLPKLQETKTGVSLQVRRIPSMERKAGTRNPLAQTEPRRFAPAGMFHQTNPIYLIRKENPHEPKNKTILRVRPDCLPVRNCHPPCRSRVGCPVFWSQLLSS